jgi:hypothetical protein
MALTDTQIERYSRQIILPEIGGRGQEALLRSRATLVGVGELAQAMLPYLAGSGIGRLVLRPAAGEDLAAAAELAERAARINPDVRADVGAPISAAEAEGIAPCDSWCETSGGRESVLALLRATRMAGTTIVAVGACASWGWMSMTRKRGSQPGCAFCGWLDASRGNEGETSGPLRPTIVGAVAALAASSIIDAHLGLDRQPPAVWLRYDAETMTLNEHTITVRENCPVCRDRAGENSCHPTLDS